MYSAHSLLHMEKNGIVERTAKSKEESLDLNTREISELGKAIKNIENIALFSLRAFRLSNEEQAYVNKKASLIIEAFLKTEMLKTGVLPHLLFSCILFAYFADTKQHSISSHFSRLANTSIYDEVFAKIEDSNRLNWNAHMSSAIESLQEGIKLKPYAKIKLF